MEENVEQINIVENDKKNAFQDSAIPLLLTGIGSMVMLFGAFTSAYIVTAGEPTWINVASPEAFKTSTIIILMSSVTMMIAHFSTNKNIAIGTQLGMLTTLALGVYFIYSQFQGYSQLVDDGIVFAGQSSFASGSYIYVLSFMHILHLVGGIIFAAYVTIMSFMGQYSSNQMLGIKMCSIYWHFLGGLWVSLYLLLTYWTTYMM